MKFLEFAVDERNAILSVQIFCADGVDVTKIGSRRLNDVNQVNIIQCCHLEVWHVNSSKVRATGA